MIDPKELRIGSMVSCSKGLAAVVGIQVDRLDTLVGGEPHSDSPDNFYPVELKPALLVQHGFEKNNRNREKTCYTFDNPVCELDVFPRSAQVYVDLVWFPHIKYFHQLQNLIHSLTNKEA
jgi:hypothetical protein